jgi:hypothetical protein
MYPPTYRHFEASRPTPAELGEIDSPPTRPGDYTRDKARMNRARGKATSKVAAGRDRARGPPINLLRRSQSPLVAAIWLAGSSCSRGGAGGTVLHRRGERNAVQHVKCPADACPGLMLMDWHARTPLRRDLSSRG